MFSSASHPDGVIALQPAAMTSARAVFPEPRAPIMATRPEDLGRVDVTVEIDADGQLAARLAFDNPAAAADLRGRADELRRQLQDAGFQLSQDSLDFSQRDPSSGGGAFDRQQQRNALFAGGSRLAAQADLAAAPIAGAWTNHSLTPERVDVRV